MRRGKNTKHGFLVGKIYKPKDGHLLFRMDCGCVWDYEMFPDNPDIITLPDGTIEECEPSGWEPLATQVNDCAFRGLIEGPAGGYVTTLEDAIREVLI